MHLVLRVHVVEARPVVLPPLEGPLSQDTVHWLEWTFSWSKMVKKVTLIWSLVGPGRAGGTLGPGRGAGGGLDTGAAVQGSWPLVPGPWPLVQGSWPLGEWRNFIPRYR